jgi:hypothetical protein
VYVQAVQFAGHTRSASRAATSRRMIPGIATRQSLRSPPVQRASVPRMRPNPSVNATRTSRRLGARGRPHIIGLAPQASCRHGRVTSNVRPRSPCPHVPRGHRSFAGRQNPRASPQLRHPALALRRTSMPTGHGGLAVEPPRPSQMMGTAVHLARHQRLARKPNPKTSAARSCLHVSETSRPGQCMKPGLSVWPALWRCACRSRVAGPQTRRGLT